jgi:hypothetical protein
MFAQKNQKAVFWHPNTPKTPSLTGNKIKYMGYTQNTDNCLE